MVSSQTFIKLINNNNNNNKKKLLENLTADLSKRVSTLVKDGGATNSTHTQQGVPPKFKEHLINSLRDLKSQFAVERQNCAEVYFIFCNFFFFGRFSLSPLPLSSVFFFFFFFFLCVSLFYTEIGALLPRFFFFTCYLFVVIAIVYCKFNFVFLCFKKKDEKGNPAIARREWKGCKCMCFFFFFFFFLPTLFLWEISAST